ncbi:MAG: MarR family transcriptional regulator [Negativicutes bacterium]|nr:MarR family transcriptional regulator [Negativicutes bacterium]MDR3588060.1 MarR family transcriptional regulator [Negativicutes bacterium]
MILHPDNICFLLARTEQRHYQYTKDLLARRNIPVTPGQLSILCTLFEGDGIGMTELSRKSHFDNSTITGLVDKLERDGFLVRSNVPGDRRAYNISLTEKSLELRTALQEVSHFVAQEMLKGCSAEEIAHFRKVLINIFHRLK